MSDAFPRRPRTVRPSFDADSAPEANVEDHVLFAGRVRTDGPARLDGHLVVGFGRRADRSLARPEQGVVGLDVVVVEHTVLAGEQNGRLEELVGAVREIHHDAIGPAFVVGRHLAHVATDARHPVRDAVSLGVGPEILDSRLVDVGPHARRAALRERDDERADTGEHVERLLAGVHLLDDAVALCRESGREVDLGEVECERTAVLTVDDFGGVAREDHPVANALFAFDLRGTVEDALDREVRGHDGFGDLSGTLRVILVDYDEGTDAFVARLEPEDVRGHGLPLPNRRVELHDGVLVRNVRGVGDGDVEPALLDRDVVPVVDEIRLGESFPGRLAVLSPDTNAGNAHTTPPPPSAVSLTLRATYPRRAPTADMLTFVGLGLYDERSVTLAGRDAIRGADRVFAEFYTSRLVGTDLETLEAFHDTTVEVRDRAGVEQDPEPVLSAAEDSAVVFLTAGDTMVSTTHTDLRLRAEERGIETRVVHGTTAQTAAGSLTGLQNYRFGKATTLPFNDAHGGDGVPDSVVATIEDNRARDLHTLVYLDIKVDDPHWDDGDETYMTADHAAGLLAVEFPETLGVVVAQAGSPDPTVAADKLEELAEQSFGDPLHMLVIPGSLHPIEDDALTALAGKP